LVAERSKIATVVGSLHLATVSITELAGTPTATSQRRILRVSVLLSARLASLFRRLLLNSLSFPILALYDGMTVNDYL
jgi:hypothetical protein